MNNEDPRLINDNNAGSGQKRPCWIESVQFSTLRPESTAIYDFAIFGIGVMGGRAASPDDL